MPWSTPMAPVSGTVITVAWASANIIDPLGWLRLMTGNADPPGPDYVVVSNSSVVTGWAKVPENALAVPKVTRSGDTMTGDLTVSRSGSAAPTEGYLYLGQNSGLRYLGYTGTGYVLRDAGLEIGGDVAVYRPSALGTGFIHFGNVPHSLGWDGSKFTFDGQTAWHAGNDGAGSGLDADLLDGQSSAFYATAASAVPTGLIAAFAIAAQIAAGWVRYTLLDGRMPIGAGTTFSVTYVENTQYGSSWAHATGIGTLAVDANTNTSAVASGAGTAANPAHAHTLSGAPASATWVIPSYALVWAAKT